MRVLVAPDKFKGTLTAVEAAEAIGAGLRAAGADVDLAPIADGGEGTLEAMVGAVGGSVMGVIAKGPMGVPVRAHVAVLADRTAVVELSQASGLRLVPEGDRDPMRASTIGTGQTIKAALARRPERLLVAIGGSATVDGGIGLARALGVRTLDEGGGDVPDGGAGLALARSIDGGGLDPRIVATPILVAADVLTPLADAARLYAPQKGATPDQIPVLERGLENLGRLIERDLHVPVLERAGAGAAGGAGAMLLGLGGDLRSGAEVVLDAVGFAERVKQADLVVTGEGLLDDSTMEGKGPAVVARYAAEAGVPCIAFAGDATVEPDAFAEVRTLVAYTGSIEGAQMRASAGLKALAARLVSDRRRA